MKLSIAVIFGGRTCEHEVSIISGLQAADVLNPESYDVTRVYIAADGEWYVGEKLKDIQFYKHFDPAQVTHVFPAGSKGKLRLIAEEAPAKKVLGIFGGGAGGLHTLCECDVVMPVMHGLNGEDGTLQGMLELFNVPYTSAGVMGCAIGMDKVACKQVLHDIGLPVLPGHFIERDRWYQHPEECLDEIEALLPYPMYVKPANLGSSIGITRADDRMKLEEAMDVAASYDRRILIEKGVEKLIEVNCSVVGYGSDVRVSVLEMPVTHGEGFLTFDEKYLKNAGAKGSQGMKSASRVVPAPIGEEMTEQIQQMALKAFRALDLKGVVRIDFIIDGATNEVYINEPNVIPGSLAYYLWEPVGLKFDKLLDKMVEDAFKASADKNRSVFSYQSVILDKMDGAKGKLHK